MSTNWSFIWKRLRSAWTIPDLRKKILFTLAMLLAYRILATITVPLTRQEQVNQRSSLGDPCLQAWGGKERLPAGSDPVPDGQRGFEIPCSL